MNTRRDLGCFGKLEDACWRRASGSSITHQDSLVAQIANMVERIVSLPSVHKQKIHIETHYFAKFT